MDAIFLFLLSSVLNAGYAWPWSSSSSSSWWSAEHVEGVQEEGHLEHQQQIYGRVTSLCTSVVADPSEASSPGASVHLCQQGSGVCFLSALDRCCTETQGDAKRLLLIRGSSSLVQLGSTSVEVNFFPSGFPSTVTCFSIPDDSVGPCMQGVFKECQRGSCAPSVTICSGNVVGERCDPQRGCQCRRGYLAPDCCQCASGYFRRNPRNMDEECHEVCPAKCMRRTPNGGCERCRRRYQGLGCCECEGDLQKNERGYCMPLLNEQEQKVLEQRILEAVEESITS